MAEALGPQPVASALYKRAAAHKNPKVTLALRQGPEGAHLLCR